MKCYYRSSRSTSLLSQRRLHNLACKLTNFWKLSFDAKTIESSSRRLGAATFHYQVISRILQGTEGAICFVQPTYRPFDYDHGLVNKLQCYHQFQVLLSGLNKFSVDGFKQSLTLIGLTADHRLVFRKSNWRSESLNAWGNGWECLLNTIEIAQITHFNQVCGIKCDRYVWEITYGLERLSFALSGKFVKPFPIEVARSTGCKAVTTARLINRLNFISVNTFVNLPKSLIDVQSHWKLLSLADVYNKLMTKTSIKRSVMRKILTKIQSHVKLIAKSSSVRCLSAG
ncbi:MAG: glycine--tRNA ligase subunit alpha [Candidatus Hodgkinia cicadicola]